MNVDLGLSVLHLPRDGLIALRDATGTTVSCRNGSLWITQECSPMDNVIGPGESLVVEQDGLTLVTALASSSLTLGERKEQEESARSTEAAALLGHYLGRQPAPVMA